MSDMANHTMHAADDQRITAAAIAALPGIGPQRLRTLISTLGVHDAWRTLRGDLAPHGHIAAMLAHNHLGRSLRRHATDQLLERTAASLADHAMRVVLRDDPEYPASLRGDFAAPAVLFAIGDMSAFSKRRVGVIGTRAASAAGRHFARRMSRELARSGVSVVSGLARGIDAAAHRGALDDEDESTAPPIAVVASGLDIVYPRENAGLWNAIARRGVIVSESPPGCAPDAFRFPLRNRILAAVSELLVVVESRASGGSMITVDEAAKRGITVMAVPGSPHSESSTGTNALIADGATTVCHADDVLIALGLDHRRVSASSDARARPSSADRVVLDALARAPATLEQLVAVLDLPVQEVALRLGHLEVQGWAVSNGGWWEALLAS